MKSTLFTSVAILSIIVSVCSCADSPQSQVGGVQNISQQEFSKIQQEENAVVIDVRTSAEVSQGYIKGTDIFADINGDDFEAQISKLDTAKSYIIYCRSGSRSSSAANYMVSKGFKKVYNLEGGILSWKGDVIKP